MSASGSISRWIQDLKSGDSRAATHLWNRYHFNLLQITRRRLNGMSRREQDEEDFVVAAFHSFFRRARDGQFPNLSSRGQLWSLLVTITDRKVVNDLRRQMSQKRGGGRVLCESTILGYSANDSEGPLAQAESFELGPDMEARLTELIDAMDVDLRRMVSLRRDGLTHAEIARRLNRSVATVERRLRLLRDTWEKELLG